MAAGRRADRWTREGLLRLQDVRLDWRQSDTRAGLLSHRRVTRDLCWDWTLSMHHDIKDDIEYKFELPYNCAFWSAVESRIVRVLAIGRIGLIGIGEEPL